MIRSMTGFGQAKTIVADFTVYMDVKSVNHRYSEVNIRMPKEWMPFEETLRKTTAEFINRGRIDIFVTVERQASASKSIDIDWSLADNYMHTARQLQERYGFNESLTLQNLIELPGLIVQREERIEPDEAIEHAFVACLKEALGSLLDMRNREGDHLARDLMERLERLEQQHQCIVAHAPKVAGEYAARLRLRVQELTGDYVRYDESRLATEIALFADRCSIDEELTRLQSHYGQFAALLRTAEPIGRKLDFLIQEMNREVNTIGSKANDAGVAAKVIDMKAELEKMREQIQNIE
ncbi:YicC family protein [Paenibacillus albiflavus]|uniref:YicC family protein n=1 Tax=Paenibacillus albiflavus TaxID=2545760 RepID=A0A4R4EJ51_9BACL|nr:YicC/YloC family endoribonuclease [Paenibacillus albiflavus]TCZ79433.1 YicC family protein [Paenibacillus albiflavus]